MDWMHGRYEITKVTRSFSKNDLVVYGSFDFLSIPKIHKSQFRHLINPSSDNGFFNTIFFNIDQVLCNRII